MYRDKINKLHTCQPIQTGSFNSLEVDPVSDVKVTAEDTTTRDYQTTIADEMTTITKVTSPAPYYVSELLPVRNDQTKSREYSHQGK